MNARRCAVIALLACHASVLVWESARHGPNGNEFEHLAAGLAVLKLGRFDLYPVNPPLVKSIAAIPALLSNAKTPWFSYRTGPGVRCEAAVAKDIFLANGSKTFGYLTWGRWALIPLIALGSLTCYRWASEMYGAAAGLGALALWCISPTIAAWASTINSDAGAAAIGATFGHALWRWHRRATLTRAAIAGAALGLALLSKFTFLILLPTAALLAVLSAPAAGDRRELGRRFAHSLFIIFTALYLVNLGYLFQGSFRALGDHVFVSRCLGGTDAIDPAHGLQGNRFHGTWAENIMVPLPAAYLTGIDLQERDFERGKWSYLRGQWKMGGWWYFYLAGIALKEPLGVALLAVWRLLKLPAELAKRDFVDGLFVALPPLALFALVSSETRFSIHLRYALPCYPFAFIWISRIFRGNNGAARWRPWAASALLAWAASSGAAVIPHSHSYFSELAGGPRAGHCWLLDASIDWGEDLFDLQRWCQTHRAARPLFIASRSKVPMQFIAPEAVEIASVDHDPRDRSPRRPPAGWYVISAHALHDHASPFRWFLSQSPADSIAYSLYVYHVDSDDLADSVPETRRYPAASGR